MGSIGDIELALIKECVKQNLYSYKFDELEFKDTENDKTFKFMISKGLTRKTFATAVILSLKKGHCYSVDRDNNSKYDDGIVYKFCTKQLDEELYVKIKLRNDCSELIMSIHRWGDI